MNGNSKMSLTDEIEEKGDVGDLLKPTFSDLNKLAKEDSRFKASDEYFLLIQERTYSPGMLPEY